MDGSQTITPLIVGTANHNDKDNTAKWVATLSDGTTAVEHSGEWEVVPGERKPWVRLISFLEENGLHLTSLRLNYRGRTIHLPRAKFERFNLQGKVPKYYSLCYHAEVEDPLGAKTYTFFVDLAAHYESFAVHYVQDITDGANSWIVITENDEPIAASPGETNAG